MALSTEPTPSPPGPTILSRTLVGIAIAFVIGVGLLRCSNVVGQFNQPTVAEQMEAEANDPERGQDLRIIRDSFPEQWARLIAAVEALGIRATSEEVNSTVREEMRLFMRRRSPELGAAPDAQLAAIVRGQRDLMVILQRRDVGLCAAFAANGNLPNTDLPPEAGPVIAGLGRASLVALREAVAHPQRRAQPSEEDGRRLWQVLNSQGASAQTLALLEGTTPFETAAQRDRCAAGLAYMNALLALPPAALGRFKAADMAAPNPPPAPSP
jgi:hypothetical protein